MLSKFGDICPMVIKANTEHISPVFEERRMKTYGGAWGFIFLPHLTQFLTSVGILLHTHRGISHSSFLDTSTMAFKQSLQPLYRNPVPAKRGCVLPWWRGCISHRELCLLPLGHGVKRRATQLCLHRDLLRSAHQAPFLPQGRTASGNTFLQNKLLKSPPAP